MHACNNAGIDPQDRLQAVQNLPKWNEAPDLGPAIGDAHEDEIVYEITFDLPDAGLANNVVPPDDDVPETVPNLAMPNVSVPFPDISAVNNKEVDESRHYPTQTCQSALGHQSYNEHTPHIAFMHQGEEEEEQHVTFLQLGEIRAHRNVLDAGRFARMTKEERMHMTTCSRTGMIMDDADHTVGPSLVTTCKAELKVWGYLMM